MPALVSFRTMAKDKKRKKKNKKSLAERADKYDLYQRSVQEPSAEVEFFEEAYQAACGRAPKILHEDFCGTFAVSCEWAKKRGRKAICVDIDPEPLAWGRENNLAKLSTTAQNRVDIHEADVRIVLDEKADVLCAQNFSYWIFKTREELRGYFEIALQNLKSDGIFVLDLMGGGECFEERRKDKRSLDGFHYLWEMKKFDPVSHEATHLIHFGFKDGSKLKRAFTYSWRFWSIPEIRELLAEAGFSCSTVYWEGLDEETGEGDGEWKPCAEGTCDPSWIAYIVAKP